MYAHRRHHFPFGWLFLAFIFFLLFGWKIFFIVPFVMFFMILMGCTWGYKDRYAKPYVFAYEADKPKRKPKRDAEYFEDDETVFV